MPRKAKRLVAAPTTQSTSLTRRINILYIVVAVLAVVAILQGLLLSGVSSSINKMSATLQQIESTLAKQQAEYNSTTAVLGANTTTKTPITGYNITGTPKPPQLSLSGYPVITQNMSFGKRLTNINAPFNATELSIINDAPLAYFETAGEMYLNGSITNEVGTTPSAINPFVLNGKASVIYLGSITCVFCGENRWAMALALSRFGNFTHLFKGYSSFGDYDLPTIYWAPDAYNGSTVIVGSFYNSSYINFIPLEDTAPITGGFSLQPLDTMQQEINATGDPVYADAMEYIIRLNAFEGTPYTIWGGYQVTGADAVDFGNSTPTSGTSLPLTNMTHDQVLQQFAHPADQFAWTEYAAADFYAALMCKSYPGASTAPICGLSAIKEIEARL